MSTTETNVDTGVLEKTKFKTPVLWTVILHNDDYTPMEFVVAILHEVFNLDIESAHEIMLRVHNEGRAPVGKFTKEIAVTKAAAVCELAERMQHPLVATPEEL
jgi:ATP-dependent Clp protease adaptor protein ClpS